jgi:hypothetical protein
MYHVVIVGIIAGGMNSGEGGHLQGAVSILLNVYKRNIHGNKEEGNTHLFRFAFVISFRRAAPSKGLRSSNAQSKSSDTLNGDPSDPSRRGFQGDLPHAGTVIIKFLADNRVRSA